METLQDIWTELGGRLRRFIGNRVRDSATADDITQDVLLKVQEELHALPAGEKLPGWVFAIARNAIIDHYRSRALRNHTDIGDIDPAADVPDAERGLPSAI